MVVGLGAISVDLILGVALMSIGAIWFVFTLSPIQRAIPVAVVRKRDLALSIQGANFTTRDDGRAIVQIVASVLNRRAPTILHSWKLDLRTGERMLTGRALGGRWPDYLGTPDLLAEMTGREPLGVATVEGSLYFGMPLQKEELDAAKIDGTLVLCAKDRYDKIWSVSKDLSELVQEGERETLAVPTADQDEHAALISGTWTGNTFEHFGQLAGTGPPGGGGGAIPMTRGSWSLTGAVRCSASSSSNMQPHTRTQTVGLFLRIGPTCDWKSWASPGALWLTPSTWIREPSWRTMRRESAPRMAARSIDHE